MVKDEDLNKKPISFATEIEDKDNSVIVIKEDGKEVYRLPAIILDEEQTVTLTTIVNARAKRASVKTPIDQSEGKKGFFSRLLGG